MTVFIDENIPYLAEELSGKFEIRRFSGRELTREDLLGGGCETLFVRSTTKIGEALLEGTGVKFVGTATSGVDHVDIEYLRDKGIAFASAPGSNSNSVAEYAIFCAAKRAFETKEDLRGKVFGIIGFGNIGRKVAAYAREMGAKVLVNDPPLEAKGFKFPEGVEVVGLRELLKRADIATNHVPLTFDGEFPTNRLLGEGEIALAKKGALFLHLSRGKVVEESALKKRLLRKELTACLDVWENEPAFDGELARLCYLSTPHVAGYSLDGKLNGVMAMIESFEEFSGVKIEAKTVRELLKKKRVYPLEELADTEKLYKTLKESRKLEEDDVNFKKISFLPEKERAAAFDALRKNYPKRRETLSVF